MATTIQVEIEHRRYVDFCVARRGEQGQLSITTIEPGQQRALIRLFAASGGKRTPVQTIDARGLPADPNRHVPMQLTAAVVSGGRLRVRLYVEGALFLERFVPIGRYIGLSRKLLLALLLLLLLLGLAGIVAGIIATRDPEETADPAVTATEEPDETDGATDDAVTDDAVVADDAVVDDEPDDDPAEPDSHVVRFNPESARLRPDTQQRLDEIAERVGEHEFGLRIDGHTAIAGTEAGRRRLSERRAENVRDYLIDAGLSAGRIAELRALGSTEPLTEDPDLQDRNRRVEIVELEE